MLNIHRLPTACDHCFDAVSIKKPINRFYAHYHVEDNQTTLHLIHTACAIIVSKNKYECPVCYEQFLSLSNDKFSFNIGAKKYIITWVNQETENKTISVYG